MTKLKYYSTFHILAIILFLVFANFAQAPKSKGKYTKKIKEPKIAHMLNEIDLGKVKRVRGKVFLGENDVPLNTIISVYKIMSDKSEFLFSFLVGANGEFDFKDLKAGSYVLKTGTTDGYFNRNDFKLLLTPNDKDASGEDLEIALEVGT
jgi:hypothetical protein